MRDLGLSYEQALHGVQGAIKYEIENSILERPMISQMKHLRVGLDARAADMAGLVGLLIKKGLFTIEEYQESLRLAMNEELARYEEHLKDKFGPGIKVSFR